MDPIVWTASPERIERSNTTRFMSAHGIPTYQALVHRSIEEPDWFWDAVVDFLGIPFSRPYSSVRNQSGGCRGRPGSTAATSTCRRHASTAGQPRHPTPWPWCQNTRTAAGRR